MGMLKYGAAALVEPGLSVDKWTDKVYVNACEGGKCRMKTAKAVIAKYDPKKYLLSHCTIIAAVETELANPKDPSSDYYIHPAYSKFVNNNGDAWSKKMLLASYKTFVGANNYLEHVQIPELSKGKVIDAVMREIPVGGKGKDGNDLTTYYVDILVATDRKHEDLVRKIEARELDTLSMGCVISYSICSKCGKRAIDESEACQHVRYQKNNTFFDSNGVQRKIAELCGHFSEPDSVKFVDASWVKQPAFTGAVMRSTISPTEEIMAKLEEANKKESYVIQEGDFLKAASHLIAQDEETPADEPAPEEDEELTSPEEEETPVDEGAAEDPAEAPAGDEEPAPPAPEEDLEFGQDDVKEFKTKLKKKVLDELSDEVLEDIGEEESPEGRELETFNDAIVTPATAALYKLHTAKKSFDDLIKKSANNLSKKQFNKLRYGAHMVLTSNDLTILADYGYNKREVLAVLSFLDSQFKKPLALPVKKAIAKIGGTKGESIIDLLGRVVAHTGRRITRKEAETALAWLRLLDYYND